MKQYIGPTIEEIAVIDEKRRIEMAKRIMLERLGEELEKRGLVQFFEKEVDDPISYGKGLEITMQVDIMKTPEPTVYFQEDDGHKMCYFMYRGDENGYGVYCTECKKDLYSSDDEIGFMQRALATAKYCPNCGAKVMNNRNSDNTIIYKEENT